jgi:2-methylcitrate dehydratase
MSPGTLVGYEGGIDNPMSWDRVVEKFHWLSEAFADENLRNRIIQAVQKLDVQPIDFSEEAENDGAKPFSHAGKTSS